MPTPAISLLLVGAGHAHLHLLAHAHRLVDAGYRLTLVAPDTFRYSGVASRTSAGSSSAATGHIDVRAFAHAHRVHHLSDVLVGLDLDQHTAETEAGHTLAWDVLSLNIGSIASMWGLEHVDSGAVKVKPLKELQTLRSRLEDAVLKARREGRSARVTIIGAGASGLELAGHLSCREAVEVRLMEASATLGPQLPAAAQTRVGSLLRRRGVSLHIGHSVSSVERHHCVLRDGSTFDHDLVVLATGLRADPLVRRLGLQHPTPHGTPFEATRSSDTATRDVERGEYDGVPVTRRLQYLGSTDVYAAGDCAHFTPGPLPKIGVYGQRQGPVLLDSLIRRSAGAALPTFTPHPHPLQILDLGGGIGMAVRGQWWWCGRSALVAKQVIDRRWLARYQQPAPR